MGFLKVKCYSCGGTYRLYSGMVDHPAASKCPFCQAEIRRDVWDSAVIPAWKTMEATNAALQNEHTERRNNPLFQLEYQTYKTPQRRRTYKE